MDGNLHYCRIPLQISILAFHGKDGPVALAQASASGAARPPSSTGQPLKQGLIGGRQRDASKQTEPTKHPKHLPLPLP